MELVGVRATGEIDWGEAEGRGGRSCYLRVGEQAIIRLPLAAWVPAPAC